MKGCQDGNEKSAGGMEQYLPWLQHWAQISKFLEKEGWDIMPGQEKADYSVSQACADGLELLIKQ